MLVTDGRGDKVLVVADGNITLVVERDTPGGLGRKRLHRLLPAITAASLAAALVSISIATYLTFQVQAELEERVAIRLQQLDNHIDEIMAGADDRSQLRSDRLMKHVDGIEGKINLLPTSMDNAAQRSTSSLIDWLANAAAAKGAGPGPLTVHPAESRPAKRRRAQDAASR